MTSFSHTLLPGKVSASHLLLVEFRGNILYLWTLRLTQGAHQVIERPIRVSKVDVSFMSPQICHAWREFCWSCMFPVPVASASASIGLLRSVSILNPPIRRALRYSRLELYAALHALSIFQPHRKFDVLNLSCLISWLAWTRILGYLSPYLCVICSLRNSRVNMSMRMNRIEV